MSIEIDGKSLDVKTEKLNQLKELFPEFFSEGKIDIARVRQILGDDEIAGQDHYELSWAGKAEARREIQRQTTATLLPDREGSINFDTSENIFIEGENLEVLRTLQKSYFGAVKVIYIDPPYNTGSDSFIYPDDYAERKEDYEKRTGQKNGEGYLNKLDLFRKNTKENGQYHSVWLSMMYPRLYLAKNLLAQDGVIFVSIDDNELSNIKALLNEIFGEENFISQIVIQSNKRGQTYKEIAKTHEYLLVYSRNSDYEIFELEKTGDALPYEDSTGKFDLWELRNRNPKFGRHNRQNLYFPIYAAPTVKDENGYSKISLERTDTFCVEVLPRNSEGLDSCWRWSTDLIKKTDITSDTPVLVAREKQGGGWNIYEKSRKSTTKAKSLWTETDVISEQGTIELGQLGLANYFDHPKPVGMIKKILKIATQSNEIVLDFFAGSGSTAQAVLELNEDGGNRKFICIQMPERCEEGSEAFKANLKTISAVCKTRIHKVIERIVKNNNGKMDFAKTEQDLGFRSYKLFYSNFKKWQSIITDKDELLKQLEIFKEPLATRPADSYDLLVELLLKSGLALSAKAEKRETSDNVPFYVVEDGQLIYALDSISDALLKDIEAIKPRAFITLGNLFTGEKADEQMTNWKLQLKESNIEFKII